MKFFPALMFVAVAVATAFEGQHDTTLFAAGMGALAALRAIVPLPDPY